MNYSTTETIDTQSLALFTKVTIKKTILDYERPQIKRSIDAYNVIIDHFSFIETLEEFFAAFLDSNLRVIAISRISAGGTGATFVDIKVIAALAVCNLASNVILFHNHPSGNLQPSQSDVELTKKIQKGLKTLDINLADHIIVTSKDHKSMISEGFFLR